MRKSNWDAVVRNAGLIAVAVPVVMHCIGTFVHNAHLGSYGWSAFDLLRTRYLYAGTTAFLVIGLVLVTLASKMRIDNFRAEATVGSFAASASRALLVSFLLAIFIHDPHLLGHAVSGSILDTGVAKENGTLLMAIAPPLWLIWWQFGDTRLVRISQIAALPLFLLIAFRVAIVDAGYSGIFLFVGLCWFLVRMLAAKIADLEDGRTGAAFFADEAEAMASNRFHVARGTILAFGLLNMLGLTYAMLTLYGSSIYPHIPYWLGGGEERPVTVLLASSSLSGSLIDESPEWVTIAANGTSYRIPREDVLQIRAELAGK